MFRHEGFLFSWSTTSKLPTLVDSCGREPKLWNQTFERKVKELKKKTPTTSNHVDDDILHNGQFGGRTGRSAATDLIALWGRLLVVVVFLVRQHKRRRRGHDDAGLWRGRFSFTFLSGQLPGVRWRPGRVLPFRQAVARSHSRRLPSCHFGRLLFRQKVRLVNIWIANFSPLFWRVRK